MILAGAYALTGQYRKHELQSLSRMQWVTVGDVDVDIGANPSAEEADEGTESTNRKVVDVVDSFRLVVSTSCNMRV